MHKPFGSIVKYQFLAQCPLDYIVVSNLLLFCANFHHLPIMWIILSCLSSHNLHLLFRCILSIFALTLLVLMPLFCIVARRNVVFILRFHFLNDFPLFSDEILLVSCFKYPYSCFSSHSWFLVVPLIIILFVLFLATVIICLSLFF